MTNDHDLRDDERIQGILDNSKRIAVIGMKPEGAAFSVPLVLAEQGFEIAPVNPKYDDVGGRQCWDSVADVPGEIDVVNVFRRSDAVDEHVDEILELDPTPKLVWLQLGIRNEEAGRRLAEAGVPVVQDRCLKVAYRRLFS